MVKDFFQKVFGEKFGFWDILLIIFFIGFPAYMVNKLGFSGFLSYLIEDIGKYIWSSIILVYVLQRVIKNASK